MGASTELGPPTSGWPPSFVCPRCAVELGRTATELGCPRCRDTVPIVAGIPRFVRSSTHASFALQWKRFADVQLDSRNGTHQSRDRLLSQSRLGPEAFRGRGVLEVGCGAGRFTEILLAFGARVAAVDHSEAIEACAATHRSAIERGQLVVAQADAFALPFPPRSFEIVLGYGMLQHTGAPRRALSALWDHVRLGGLLLVDRYALDLRHFLPFKYALRPFTRDMAPEHLLGLVERACARLVPIERAVLRRARGRLRRWLRYLLGRAPNSTFPLALEAEGRLTADFAYRWSVLDTFDQYSPKYDLPCTAGQWRDQIRDLQGGEIRHIGVSGQGHVAVVERVT